MSKFALLFALVFIGGLIATVWFSGGASFVLYQLIYFANPENRWWSADLPSLRFSLIASLSMILALGFGYRRYSEMSPWREQPMFKWIIALLVMYYVMYAFALDPASHHRFTIEFTKLVVVVFVAYKLLNSRILLDASLWAYLVGCTYIGYVATTVGRGSSGRVEGIGMVDGTDANDTAAALVGAAPLLMYYAWMGNARVRLLAIFCAALIANGLVLLNSRGAFLGVVVGSGVFLLFMIFSRYQRKGQRPMAIVIILLGIGGALYVTDDQFWARMSTLQNLDNKAESGASRVEFWLTTFEMMRDYPAGLGVNGYNVLAPHYMDDETRGGVENRSVHSMWFQGLSEVGWVGISIFFMLLISLGRASRQAQRWLLNRGENVEYFHVLAIQCSLLGYLVAGSFLNRFRAEVLYWMILLLAVGINVYFLQAQRNQRRVVRSPEGARTGVA